MSATTKTSDTSSYITAWCVNCEAARYRSTRPLSRNDKLSPELFIPVAEDIPAPPKEGQATCYLCDTPLKFVAEQKLAQATRPDRRQDRRVLSESEQVEQRLDVLAETVREAHSPSRPIVEELFRLDSDEKMVNTSSSPDGESIFLLTTKRLVRIRV